MGQKARKMIKDHSIVYREFMETQYKLEKNIEVLRSRERTLGFLEKAITVPTVLAGMTAIGQIIYGTHQIYSFLAN